MQIKVTYYDAAMTLMEVAGLRLLTDPVLDPAGTVVVDGPVRLVKTAPPIDRAALGQIDAVLLSHDQHADNLDESGRALLAEVPLVLTTPEAAMRLGGAARGLAEWETVTLAGAAGTALTVTAVPARHGPDAILAALGPVTGFVIAPTEGEGRSIYVSGDTVPFAGLAEIAARFAPIGLALIHVGSAQVEPLGPVPLSLSAREAALLALELDAVAILPIHYEGWAHLTETRGEAEAAFAASDVASRVHWLERGVGAVFDL